jgi:hypothetical protein
MATLVLQVCLNVTLCVQTMPVLLIAAEVSVAGSVHVFNGITDCKFYGSAASLLS